MSPQLDPLLLPFVQAAEEECEEVLGELLTRHARPVIRGILLRQGAGGAEAGDLESEVVVHLIERLRRLRRDPTEGAIRDYLGYVAVATFNALHAVAVQVRRRGPERVVLGGREGDPMSRIPDPAPDAASALERRSHLARLWEEIRQLPPRQAAAVLLNLRDERGGSAARLLPLTGTASLREIAEVLGMTAERFAELWNRLPLEDAAIAGLLGVTRQQVINLRKSARERLGRRMRGLRP